jgi:HEAT repeat protein
MRTLLTASRPDERATATQLIGLLGAASDATCVERGLHDSSASVRRESALALGRIGGEEDVPALIVTLDDQVPAVRAAAAVSLGRLRAPGSETSLLSHAQSDHFEVARAAAVALVEIDPLLATDAAAATHSAHLLEVLDLGRLG